jgi:hypothetical protein
MSGTPGNDTMLWKIEISYQKLGNGVYFVVFRIG